MPSDSKMPRLVPFMYSVREHEVRLEDKPKMGVFLPLPKVARSTSWTLDRVISRYATGIHPPSSHRITFPYKNSAGNSASQALRV